MLRDIFYFGSKPNVHPRERPADNIDHARSLCTTDHFWIVNEYCDYTNFEWDFDFEFLPDEDVWAEEHNNVWPSIYQKDSGTWLCPKEFSALIVYRNDVTPLKRKNIKTANWVLLDKVDESKFDFGWHPDPTDPPYIYCWGNKFYPVELGASIEYRVDNATQIKYMNGVVELLPDWERWNIPGYIDKNSFDFSWRPDPREPALIYEFGTQHQKTGGPQYICEDATDIKYIHGMSATSLPIKDKWQIVDGFVIKDFDYSWHPDSTEEPYIYVFGNNLYPAQECATIMYVVDGATQTKYVNDIVAILGENKNNWIIPDNIDTTSFDFSWIPNPTDPPFIYESGTQWQKTGGPRYVVEGATEVKYLNAKATALPNKDNWHIVDNDIIDTVYIDYSWHPDATESPYIYVFGNQYYSAEIMPTIQYVVEGATEIKYISDIVATIKSKRDNWIIPNNIAYDNEFDFNWIPNPKDPPYIYQFSTQWQKTGGIQYIVKGATEFKYMDTKVTALPTKENWEIVEGFSIKNFDYSWHPDATEEPYIYVFGNNLYPAQECATIKYNIPGATEIKYVNDIIAVLAENKDNWIIPDNIDTSDFDFSWIPNPTDPPYIYVSGTQHQKTGGPVYVVDGATEFKYMDTKVTALPTKENWCILNDYVISKFDYSWHPDATEEPYIYVFGNNFYSAQECPTIHYTVPGATQIKYVTDIVAILGENKNNWIIPDNIDTTDFDFSWVPNPNDPPYIYVSGTQHQKTGGPYYVVEGATEAKYIDVKVTALPTVNNWSILNDYIIDNFDYSWHPDATEEPYIYVFGNNLYPAQECPTVQYIIPNATEIKYVSDVVARLGENKNNWQIPDNIDTTGFDFSWIPNPTDPSYIYHFGTQWQKSGGPIYVIEGATEVKYIDIQKVKAVSSVDNWQIVPDIKIKDFDYSWHPDSTEEPYIYVFGNNLYPAEECPTVYYRVPGAIAIKYVNDIVAVLDENKDNWQIPDNIDTTGFDFSWIPNPTDPPYIYVSGTQHQKTGGPYYVAEGASEIKYIDIKVKALPSENNWQTIPNILVKDFDYSWHPDATEEPYIYVFGNNLYPAQECPTLQYVISGATQIKYVNDIVATLDQNKNNWIIPDNIDTTDFDFSWIPNPTDPPFIYHYGTQWQRSGGPIYVVEDAIEIKYMDAKVKALPTTERWQLVPGIKIKDFDYSWHPDVTEDAYVCVFGNNLYPAQECPTIQYVSSGATEIKYVNDIVATLDQNKDNWQIPDNIDTTGFDFSWIPNPTHPAYIYVFGTQWQRSGGPYYVVEGATEIKYIDSSKAKALPSMDNWQELPGIKVKEFDYSWHPDTTEEPYIYVFGNTLYPAEECPTIQYIVSGATQIKYIHDIVATLDQNKTNWNIPDNIDTTDFDFSWIPNPTDPPYIYVFGTQHQKTGGPYYVVEGASEIKYIDSSKAKALPRSNDDSWYIPKHIDVSNFDFSWHPDATEEPYIYEFGTQWQKTGGPVYNVHGATQVKYVSGSKAIALPKGDNWEIPEDINIDNFDFSWHPDSTENNRIYQFGTQWQKTGGPKYIVEYASNENIVYVSTIKANKLPSKKNWFIPDNIDPRSVDYTWHPDDTEEPYIYEFGTQWNDRGGPKYIVPGAEDYKYSNKYTTTIIGKTIPNKTNWESILPIDEETFDYTWVPHPHDPPYIYVFGNQWHDPEIEPTMIYHVEDATEIKYVKKIKANVLPIRSNWTVLEPIDEESFDFSWRPNPKDPPYIYVFGNQFYPAERMPSLVYTVEGATDYKYINDIIAKLVPDMSRWVELIPVDKNKFDFNWIPDPGDPPYIYVFGNQWHRAEEEPTLEYHAPGATERKCISEVPLAYHSGHLMCAYVLPDMKRWEIPAGVKVNDFDFTWRPDPSIEPYIYQFGTEDDQNDGPRYVPLKNNGIVVNLSRVYKEVSDIEEIVDVVEVSVPEVQELIEVNKYTISTTLEDLINEHPNEIFWAVRDNIDYSKFDFDWRPTIEQTRYIQVFGSPDSESTQTYFVSSIMYNHGYKDFKYIEPDKKADEEYLATLFKQIDMFFVDRGNVESKNRFERLKQKYPTIQKTRFLNSWVDTISRCINRSNTELCWILNSEYDYNNFNFNYYPNPWQMNMVHVFGTQWNHWGNTYIVNRETFSNDTKYIKIIEHLSNLNFVKDRRANATNNLYDMWIIDHGNDLTKVKETLERKSCGKSINIIAYDTNYLTTFRNLVTKLPEKKEDYIWLCSSICDYSNFDFSYTVDPFAKDNLHVFSSDKQKFGDTFFVDVNKTKEVIDSIDKLQAYPKINYNNTLRAARLPAPIIDVNSETHIGALNVDYNFPYAVFQTEQVDVIDQEPISLWSDDMKTITVTSTGATRIIVPKEAKDIVKNELYDYPYIKTASKLGSSKPMDIVFLSNGEQCADENYKHLLAVTKHTKNRVVRVDGIDGRVAAYHAAAEASNTPWALTVFAKLKVNAKFDWGWQPDRMQIPKHYIFHAKNPVNGLEYGHQGMIAYNKKLTLANQGKGLDFTLDDPHETVKLLSGTAVFNTDPYATWRTAFREVIKLQSDYSDIASERLNIWTTVAEGEFAEYCLQGAKDAVEFYDSVMGDIDELKKSYEWEWLKEFYRKKYR